MLFSLGSTVLILMITASLAMRKGLYRSTILFFCCLAGAVVAFSYYENVLEMLNWEFARQFGEGVSLLLLFLAVALVLDLLSERFLTGTIRLPVLADRIGGGFVGFWTAMIAVGVLCVAIQMLPWDREVLGFDRITRDTKRRERMGHLLLRPDEFTAGLVGYLSGNALGGKSSFDAIHPNLMEELARSNMRVQAESDRIVPSAPGGAKTFDVISIFQLEDPTLGTARPVKNKEGKFEIDITRASREPSEGNRFLVAKCKLRKEAADDDDYHRFTPQQVRIVGTTNGTPEQYFLKGYREPSRMKELAVVSDEQPILIKSAGESMLQFVFEVPQDFQPSFVEYKRLARGEVYRSEEIKAKTKEDVVADLKYVPPLERKGGPGVGGLDALRKRFDGKTPTGRQPTKRPAKRPPPKAAPAKPTPAKPASPKPPPAKPAAQPKSPPAKPASTPEARAAEGRVGGRLVREAVFNDALPFALSPKVISDSDPQASKTGTSFGGGHIYVPAEDVPGGTITRFQVPKGAHLLQLECDALHARSLLGKAKSFAVKTVAQYAVKASNGTTYLPVGEYRIADMGGQMMMELQYDPEGLPGKCVRPPLHIVETKLTDGSKVTLLYHIPPKTKLVEMSAGPQALSKSTLNVTSPD
ncbi:MAG: CvpA family protein [Phycisphaerae bacterium]|nr:CvpA family protein [Phycisphaerae bacterium]